MANVVVAWFFTSRFFGSIRVPHLAVFEPIGKSELQALLSSNGFSSAIKEDHFASMIANDLGIPIPTDRRMVRVEIGDTVILAKVMGKRHHLTKNLVKLPEGMHFDYVKVTLIHKGNFSFEVSQKSGTGYVIPSASQPPSSR